MQENEVNFSKTAGTWTNLNNHFCTTVYIVVSSWQYADNDDDDSELCVVRAQTEFWGE